MKRGFRIAQAALALLCAFSLAACNTDGKISGPETPLPPSHINSPGATEGEGQPSGGQGGNESLPEVPGPEYPESEIELPVDRFD